MATVKHLMRRVEAVSGNEGQIIEKVFVQNEKAFADKQREQLYAGFDSDGERLNEYRSPLYAEFKHRMNPLPGEGNPDFNLTGAFYRGIEARVDAPAIRILLNDEKSVKLLQRDPNIVGLSVPFKREIINETLNPAVVGEMKKQIGL